MSSVEKAIQKIQKRLFCDDIDARKVLKYIKYLEQLEVDVDVLKRTGIGKTINGLKKMEGPIGDAAANLIKRWKEIVTGKPDNTSELTPTPVKLNTELLLQESDTARKSLLNTSFSEKEKNCSGKSHAHSSDLGERHARNIDGDDKVKGDSKHKDKMQWDKRKDKDNRKRDNLDSRVEHSDNRHDNEAIKQKHKEHKRRREEKGKIEKQHETTKDGRKDVKYTETKAKAPSLQLCDVSFGCETLPQPVRQKKRDTHSSTRKDKQPKTDSSGLSDLPPLPSVYSVNEALLPEIQPLYRPSRLLECEGSPAKKSKGTISGSILSDSALTSKKTRTQVFSGRRNAFSGGEISKLFNMCMKVLIENIDALHDTGGVPGIILMPVLMKCTPQQLIHLEECNPHFLEETESLWQGHCKREFKCEKPGHRMTWRDTFMQKMEEREERLEKINAKISAAQAAKKPERQVKLAYVMTEAKPPPQVRRKQAKFGTGKGDIPVVAISPGKSRAPVRHSADSGPSYQQEAATAKKKNGVAPMMKKTMKLLKIQRNCAGAQIRRR
ncbi:transcription elongation factor B polypeptide 3 [Nematostella vectensis]|uniref:transcription elongation factor B polypeptide 3 n=1 Tax=Nematostella vectensis TaxID=45351 RepID=UPI0013904EE2|nr:transcription elongation factor B polypeptide 3 [Nematostella vectensis]